MAGRSTPRMSVASISTEKYVSSLFVKLGLPAGSENRRVLAVPKPLRD